MSSGDTQGQLDMMLLAVLSAGPAHGYAQIEALRARSGGTFDIAEGTLYPALHKLERAGLVRSHWEHVAGRKRRVYVLTADGDTALVERRDRWVELARSIESVLGGTLWPTTS